MLAISLIIAGILLRFAPHAPNFTPVAAIAIFAGVYLNKRYALIVPLALMVISDLFIGMHNVALFTWAGFALTVFIGFWVRQKKSALRIGAGSLLSSLLFYIISNFGVWAMGWYPQTFKGLLDCYVLAIPFLRNFTVSTGLYTLVFFASYELIARLVKGRKLAEALLTN